MRINHNTYMETLELIKLRISEELKNCGYTQTEIARKLNVSQSCIAHYIKGDIVPAIDTLSYLCKFLQIDANYILGIDNETIHKNQKNINNTIADNHGIINQTIHQ